jgi:hypothetical protein
VLIRAFTPPGKPELGEFALRCAVLALDEYDTTFEIPYPLPKSDMVAIPEFAAGAMENWGLVTCVVLFLRRRRRRCRRRSAVAPPRGARRGSSTATNMYVCVSLRVRVAAALLLACNDMRACWGRVSFFGFVRLV